VSRVEIEINPRIHIGLISMHAGAPRRNGGVGFAIEGPTALVTSAISPRIAVIDRRPKPMDAREVDRLRIKLDAIREELALQRPATVEITGDFLTHYGMGSGTAIQLACIEALLELNQRRLGRHELVRLSSRGGTSGIGISTYFDGGAVFDLGVKGGETADFVPSSVAADVTLPLQLHRQDFPDWRLGVCLPRKCRPKTQEEEIEFFRRVTPLPRTKSFEAAYVAVFEVLASLMQQDYYSFCRGIASMQECEWKRLERAEYFPYVDYMDAALRALGGDCVGMSSLGPMLYFFGSSETLERVRAHSDNLDADIILTSPKNSGRRLKVI